MYKIGIISEAYGTIPLTIPLVVPLVIPPLPEKSLPCSCIPFTYLESLLCVWCDSGPLWSQVACVLTSPLPLPSPFSFPAPQRFPISTMCPPTTTLRHRLHIVRYKRCLTTIFILTSTALQIHVLFLIIFCTVKNIYGISFPTSYVIKPQNIH